MQEITKSQIKNLLMEIIDKKLASYRPAVNYMPFIEAVFEKEVVFKSSFVNSFYKHFSTSIYEEIVLILAQTAGYKAVTNYKLLGSIDRKTEFLINQICFDIRRIPDKNVEIDLIRKSIVVGEAKPDTQKQVDVFITKPNGEELYIDLIMVKPKLEELRALRKKMLRWCALRFSQNHTANVRTCIGIPYNPYYPTDYKHWIAQVCDSKEDILIQNDLWREFAGYDVFPELLGLFEEVGVEMKAKFIKFFSRSL